VSRPRKPFGTQHPGRLPATMMKVLAAEISDPSRLRRGKQYAKDGSVLDIVIDPGTVTCEIQGSRSTPYIAVVAVKPGDGMPLRRDVTFTCTCPDNDNWDSHACKHVVATMFTLSDEFLVEPELLDVWRDRSSRPEDDAYGPAGDDRADDDHHGPSGDGEDPIGEEWDVATTRVQRRRGHLRLVGADDRPPREPSRPEPPRADPLADLTHIPAHTSLPEIGQIERVEPMLPKSRDLAAVLRDAVSHLRIDWD
jgi:hypothetical protein